MGQWLQSTIGNILTLNYGKGLPKKKRQPGNVPVYGSNGIIGWHINPLVNEQGIIVGRKGTVGAVQFSKQAFFPIDTTYFIKSDDTNLDLTFLYFLLKYVDLSRLVSDLVPGLNRDLAYSEKIYIPVEIEEQKKIAAVLSLVQEAISQQEKAITLTTELKKALMQKLFTEGTRNEPQKMTAIGLIPESWDVLKLRNFVEYIDYGISKAIPKTAPPKGIKVVSTADIDKEGNLLYKKVRYIEAPEKTIKRLTLQDGDVLFNWRNSAELIGKTTIFKKQSEPHIFASFILRIRCNEKSSHNFFLKYLMNFWREEGVFFQLCRRAVNQANYNKNEISVLEIPVPSYTEQVEIANRINLIENKLNIIKAKKQNLTGLFQTLLHQLMTAQIRVDELDLSALNLEL